MTKLSRFTLFVTGLLISLIVAGCLPTFQSSERGGQSDLLRSQLTGTPLPTLERIATAMPTALPPSPLLAYLRDGDVWLYSQATQIEVPLTDSGASRAFTWSPDGDKIAVYTGSEICTYAISADPVTSAQRLCLSLNSFERPETTTLVDTTILWSPKQSRLLVIDDGWWLVNLSTSQIMHIVDPQDWGATWPAGYEGRAFTGPGIFLPTGSLIGAFTHAYDCGSGGCLHQMFMFDEDDQRFSPYAFASGGSNLVLAANGRYLASLNTSSVGCGFYTTYLNITDLNTGQLWPFTFEQEVFFDLAFTSDGEEAILSPGEGCGGPERDIWSISCGLTDAFEIFPMQRWDWQNDRREELVPGLDPVWNADGSQIAFRSCLAQTPLQQWTPIDSGSPWIYTLDFSQDNIITPIAPGAAPAWQP